MRARAKKKSRLSCSFCRRDAETVNKLIGGPGVYICDACVDVCNKILGGKTASSHPSDCHGSH